MRIIIKNISVEADHPIRFVKCYYNQFYKIYNIFTAKFSQIKSKLILQISLKYTIT